MRKCFWIDCVLAGLLLQALAGCEAPPARSPLDKGAQPVKIVSPPAPPAPPTGVGR
jgi:hypothetical protein